MEYILIADDNKDITDILEKYVKKGMRLYIEGRIRTRSWDDQNGVKRYTTEIYADNMQMLSFGRQEGADMPNRAPGASTAPSAPMNAAAPDDSDDLPF